MNKILFQSYIRYLWSLTIVEKLLACHLGNCRYTKKTMRKAAITATHSIVTNFAKPDILTQLAQQKTVCFPQNKLQVGLYRQMFNHEN